MYLGDIKKGEIEITKENLIYENKYCKFYNDDVKISKKIKRLLLIIFFC